MKDDFARIDVGRYGTKEKGHGRLEHRTYYFCDDPADLGDCDRWKGPAAIGAAINITTRDGKQTNATRHCILSRRLDAKAFADAARSHWRIEDSLHWQLDVTFGRGLADANLSVVRRVALGLLKNEKSEKVGVKNKRLAAACNTRDMKKVLTGL